MSALNKSYEAEIERIKAALNGLSTGGESIKTTKFDSLGHFAEKMSEIERAVAA